MPVILRPRLPAALRSADALARLPDGAVVLAAGLVACRQRPGSARGFVFPTLEDETGLANAIVRPHLYEQQRDLAPLPLAALEATVQREGDQDSLLARRFLAVEDLARGPIMLAHREQHAHSRR